MENNEIRVETEGQATGKKSIFDKAKAFVGKGVDKVKSTVEDIKNDPMEAGVVALEVVSAVSVAALTIAGIKSTNKLDKSAYCDEICQRVDLKRGLTNKDLKELDYRMKTGQTKLEALDDMGVLKK